MFMIGCLALASYAEEAKSSGSSDDHEKPRAIVLIDHALRDEDSTANIESQVEHLRRSANAARELTKQNHEVQEILKSVVDAPQQRPSPELANKLRNALRESREILAFEPVTEAPLPKGFPNWTPVGEIRIKQYPAYRSARTTMDGEKAAFLMLFKHIASNNISMTAPVEMSYVDAKSDKPRGVAMAFLYSDMSIGKTGPAGNVSVEDVPTSTAVSIGVRGDITSDAVAAARSRLRVWLEHQDQFDTTVDLRVLGYNSPMIPAAKRYFEVEVPVRERQAGK
jgi:hypothetical protein